MTDHIPFLFAATHGGATTPSVKEKKFTLVPLPGTGAAIATSRNFQGTLDILTESGQHFSVRVSDGRAVTTEVFDPHGE